VYWKLIVIRYAQHRSFFARTRQAAAVNLSSLGGANLDNITSSNSWIITCDEKVSVL
jgi:hypothetical protein